MKISWRNLRALLALTLAACVACPPAQALVTLNDGHDRIHVTGTFAVSHDSNVFAANGAPADYLYSSGFSADYQRRAGWIGVNANVAVSGGHYGSIKGQDYSDPAFTLELTKQTGRTTGSLKLSAARESRADAAVNTRNTSWNIPIGLSYHYHIAGTYDLAGRIDYAQRKYLDDVTFANLSSYTSSVDLIHLLPSERDLMVGYRYRYSETSRHTSSTDHNFSAGVDGRVLRGINGSLRVGYQIRTPHGRRAPTASTEKQFQSWSATGSASYAINKKTNLTGSLSKDFSTTALDTSVDTLVASLDGQYAYSSRWAMTASAGLGDSKFLGEVGTPRHDIYLTANAGVSYTLNEHLRLGLSYLWFQNWSTSSFADFVRSSWSLNASSTW